MFTAISNRIRAPLERLKLLGRLTASVFSHFYRENLGKILTAAAARKREYEITMKKPGAFSLVFSSEVPFLFQYESQAVGETKTFGFAAENNGSMPRNFTGRENGAFSAGDFDGGKLCD